MSKKPDNQFSPEIMEAGEPAGKESAGSAGGVWKICGVALVAVLVISFAAWQVFSRLMPENVQVFRNEFPAMGTVANISVYTSEADLERANELCQREFASVVEVCSLFNPDSELVQLNSSAADMPFVCSPMMWELLMRSKKAYQESGGKFDITVKPLMDLWGFYRKRGMPPSAKEIAEVKEVVGFDKLVFDEKSRSVRFSRPGMALDFGGIAKGYAADRAAAAIVAAGITSGVIDIGGNLRMLPEPPPEKKFYKVAIRDPKNSARVLDIQLTVKPGMAVSTSGDYERFVIYQGKRYGHIISPETGCPAAVCAVTVVADSAVDADVFSTSCCLGGKDMAEVLKKRYPSIQIHFTR